MNHFLANGGRLLERNRVLHWIKLELVYGAQVIFCASTFYLIRGSVLTRLINYTKDEEN
jgi:hypothetical protein